MSNPERAQLAILGAHADEAPGRPRRIDTPEDLEALRRVSDAAIGNELFRRREARTPTGAT